MTGIMVILATIPLNLSLIGGYLGRICRRLESIENSEEEEEGAE